MFPLQCLHCNRIFLGYQVVYCKQCLSEPRPVRIEDTISVILHTTIRYHKPFSVLKRLLYVCKIHKESVFSLNPSYVQQFRLKLKEIKSWTFLNEDDVEFVEWIEAEFGNSDLLRKVRTYSEFKDWITRYRYTVFEEDLLLFEFCWNPSIFRFLLSQNQSFSQIWLFMKHQGYTMVEWLYYHYSHYDKLSNSEMIDILIRWNLIYIHHLHDYNKRCTPRTIPYYDWLFVCDIEIDMNVYFYLQEHISTVIPDLPWTTYVEKQQQVDIFYYYYMKRPCDWSAEVDHDYTSEYPNYDFLPIEWNDFIFSFDLSSWDISKTQDEWMEWFAQRKFSPQITYEVSHYFLGVDHKKSVFYAIKSRAYSLAYRISRNDLCRNEQLDMIKNDTDFIMYLLS